MRATRRAVLHGVLAGAALMMPQSVQAQFGEVPVRRIPSSGEIMPPVGLGTWITFNVGDDAELRAECTAVMQAFFEMGGRMIDSSPMYGSSQAVVGNGLRTLGHAKALFAADKVWISSGTRGPSQIEESRRLWDVPRFDLLQVHNLLSWEEHLKTLFAMKAAGQLRYVGITTSEGRRHDLFEEIMRRQPLDFVQLTYNIVDRDVEERILPLAADRGMGVIVNRPFQQGVLLRRLSGHPLPSWAADIDASNWAQFVLKFIISHPAVTVAIPATSQVAHVRENMAAMVGPMPDAAMRRRMADYVGGL
ncbi:aldo/keto reductase (plasmid) [Azospirillum brasilense]|uniref:Aldo/keto reductase n=4 Tax=Azospirillum brasilense TaxID=192 RepID=A0A4D8QU13_AZOBR|nr:aldo/keto reductase [Azospirillum brasilense]PWC94266.1 aldo/keto reductase [Azospirillum sp. Sp 7]OPH12734.1 aldo/keto reductase [Azospirillum brasilense]OPH18959.1 aldo/keto reductase [Azospirillum brasilense]QCO12570.1 aldo/keto reductase [Azospirillum brasilense]QEL93610.1 aldo/keto reductase [Azospirillum brasilense]